MEFNLIYRSFSFIMLSYITKHMSRKNFDLRTVQQVIIGAFTEPLDKSQQKWLALNISFGCLIQLYPHKSFSSMSSSYCLPKKYIFPRLRGLIFDSNLSSKHFIFSSEYEFLLHYHLRNICSSICQWAFIKISTHNAIFFILSCSKDQVFSFKSRL